MKTLGKENSMFMSNKRKRHPILAMAVGGFAIFGAYKMVCCVKDGFTCCKDKITMIGRKKKCQMENSSVMGED